MDNKRIFILGAGFSKSLGMPLATELTPLILNEFKKHDMDDMLAWYEYLEKRIKWLESNTNKTIASINIEQVFDLAYFDIIKWRMEQHKCELGRNHGDTPWNKADSIASWLNYMEEDLSEIIWKEQKKAQERIETISNFTKNLNPDDVIITFNYDTLLEKSLTDLKKKWNYAFEYENGSGLKIYKMHGSINWIMVPRSQEENFGYEVLFKKKDLNQHEVNNDTSGESEYDYILLKVPNESLKGRIENKDLQMSNKSYSIALGGLGRYKSLDKIPGLGVIWSNAMASLRSSEKVCVIGFSLSSYDIMARLNFCSIMLKQTQHNMLQSITIIDPYAYEIKSNFQSVFGKDTKFNLINEKIETINWSNIAI